MAGWDERIAQLEAEFPGWHIWRSNADRWWATRTGAGAPHAGVSSPLRTSPGPPRVRYAC